MMNLELYHSLKSKGRKKGSGSDSGSSGEEGDKDMKGAAKAVHQSYQEKKRLMKKNQ